MNSRLNVAFEEFLDAELDRIESAHKMILEGYENPQEALRSAKDMISAGRGQEEVFAPDGTAVTWDTIASLASDAIGRVAPPPAAPIVPEKATGAVLAFCPGGVDIFGSHFEA
jgi:hypothetical protein